MSAERSHFRTELDDRGVACVTLARPEKHNAFNAELIAGLTRVLRAFDGDDRVRCVLLMAEGKSFSAGADLNWMRAMAAASERENQEDARALVELMATLDGLGPPTVALVQGPAIGGGVGLVACCDLVVAAEEAVFALSEVRLGLIPAVIQPYVATAIGHRAATRYTLTGERFSAAEVRHLGLVHEVAPAEDLQARGEEMIDQLLKGGPGAQRAAKAQLRELRGRAPGAEVNADAATRIAALRVGAEGQEGIAAFLEKRRPIWRGEV